MQAGALIVGNDAVLTGHRREIARLAARHAVPTIYARREFAVAGGLISYGSSITAAYRHVGIYVGKILKGAEPADLPVESPLGSSWSSTSRPPTLGLTVPPSILARPDEVIE